MLLVSPQTPTVIPLAAVARPLTPEALFPSYDVSPYTPALPKDKPLTPGSIWDAPMTPGWKVALPSTPAPVVIGNRDDWMVPIRPYAPVTPSSQTGSAYGSMFPPKSRKFGMAMSPILFVVPTPGRTVPRTSAWTLGASFAIVRGAAAAVAPARVRSQPRRPTFDGATSMAGCACTAMPAGAALSRAISSPWACTSAVNAAIWARISLADCPATPNPCCSMSLPHPSRCPGVIGQSIREWTPCRALRRVAVRARFPLGAWSARTNITAG